MMYWQILVCVLALDKMSASSFLIAALINPLYFTFTDDGSKLLNFEGRTLLKQKVDGAWRDLDARTVYKY